jgi:integrase
MKAALRRGLVRENRVGMAQRPRSIPTRWRILIPVEAGAVERAFDKLIDDADAGSVDREKDDLRTARVLFLTFLGTGIRRGEALGLHWRAVKLADPDGPTLRVEETWVRCGADTPKSRAGTRTIALGPRLAGELMDHRARSPFDGDDDLVFPNGRTGNTLDITRYTDLFRKALKGAGIEGRVRPCHDLRHSSITNSAAAGTRPEALMARAGHSSYTTTRIYVDLAGEEFRDDADLLEARLWGVREPAA